MPSIAALDLIGGLASRGCEIAVRADVDEAGFVVVEQVRSAAPAAAVWRFDVATYAEHLGLPPGDTADEGHGNTRRLREMYGRQQIPMHEESLLDLLIADLAMAAQ